MSYIELGTWEEQADHCYRIIYIKGQVTIKCIGKIEEEWADNLTYPSELTDYYLTEIKFECRANAVHYLRQFADYESDEPALLNLMTSIKEFLNNEPFPLTNCLDYIEL